MSGDIAIDYSGNGYHGEYFGDYTLHGAGGVEWGPNVRTGGVKYVGPEPVDLDVATGGIFSIESVAMITEHGSVVSLLVWKGQSMSGISNWLLGIRDIDNPPAWTLWGTDSPEIAFGSWHHYCVTCDGTTVRYYVDGALVNSAPWLGAPGTTDNPVRVGSDEFPDSSCWKGRQRNVAVFNKCLTPQQVMRHALYGLAGA